MTEYITFCEMNTNQSLHASKGIFTPNIRTSISSNMSLSLGFTSQSHTGGSDEYCIHFYLLIPQQSTLISADSNDMRATSTIP